MSLVSHETRLCSRCGMRRHPRNTRWCAECAEDRRRLRASGRTDEREIASRASNIASAAVSDPEAQERLAAAIVAAIVDARGNRVVCLTCAREKDQRRDGVDLARSSRAVF